MASNLPFSAGLRVRVDVFEELLRINPVTKNLVQSNRGIIIILRVYLLEQLRDTRIVSTRRLNLTFLSRSDLVSFVVTRL